MGSNDRQSQEGLKGKGKDTCDWSQQWLTGQTEHKSTGGSRAAIIGKVKRA